MGQTHYIAFESHSHVLLDLRRDLPRVAELIGEKPENVIIMYYSNFPGAYMNGHPRDRVVHSMGLLPGIPSINSYGLQRPGRPGNGIYIYESPGDPPIRYALYCANNARWEVVYLVVGKGKLFRLCRRAHRLNALLVADDAAPVLQPGLLDEIVQSTVGFLRRRKEIAKYGVRLRRGVVLDGPPGNGKTMVCRYLRKLCVKHHLPWGSITSASLNEAHSKDQLAELFQRYAVAFFDDIDISYLDRTRGCSDMACAILAAMDGISHDHEHLVRVFTTNESVKDLDRAFRRPGRIDRVITLNKPDASLRHTLIASWPKEILEQIDIDRCAARSEGFSFAELEAVRALLVMNFAMGDRTWDLDKAFDELTDQQQECRKIGFDLSTALSKGRGLCSDGDEAPAIAQPTSTNR